MKHIKYLLIAILLLPISVFAYEIKCEDKGIYGYEDTFSCVLKGNSGVTYESISGELEKNSTSVLSCEIEKLDNGLEIMSSEDNQGTSFSLSGTLNSEDIVKYNCKVATKPSMSQQEQLVISELRYDISDDNKTETTEVIRSNAVRIQEYIETPTGDTKPRDTSNPNSRAKEIKINNDSSIFTFSSFKTIYDIELKYEVSDIELFIVPNNENATYEVKGNTQLEIGINVIDVYIISPDETSKTCYTLNIKRLKRGEDIYYPEKDSSLSDLKVDGYTINFESVIDEYRVHLTYDVDSLKVVATPKESGSIVEISNTSNLRNGSVIEINVTSQDGSNKSTYYIKITKDSPPKDYRNLIYGGAIVVAIVVVIIIIIITNTRNKNNPLIKGKNKKEDNNVPPVQPVVQEQPVAPEQLPTPVVETPSAPQPVVPPTPEVPTTPAPTPMPQVEVQQPVQPEGTIPPQQ